ncbi:MAG: ornithine--oxo-acid transaminase [Rickettsiaceae bacterium]|jgi:ornithine--oxo-acid transaminase|nr:ornithine--oxo-acid transaminase [Rickettsiaceae bacterium]
MDPIIKKEMSYTAHNYHPLPVVITKGKGVYLWDNKGKKYIDMMSAYSAVSHGHGHPRILAALKKQSKDLCIVSRAFHTDRLAPFLEKLCKVTGFPMALPMNTGAEAVETAIKAARLWGYKVKGIEKNKAKIIVAKQNFHGRTTTIVSFSSEPAYKEGFGPYTPGFITVPFGDADALEAAITPEVCAFIVEPMQGEGGIIIPPKGWLKKVQKICKKNNVLLILDEIQTGLGRTGKMFAFQHEIDSPDGIILGKALGGGIMPVSAFLARRDIMELFTPGSHGSTFGGNPIAAAIGLEALNVLVEEKLVENSAELGKYMLSRVKAIKSNAISEVRGSGLWVGVDINPKYASARKVCERMMAKGVLCKETHDTVVRLAPPLVITKDIIDKAIDCLEETLREMSASASN